MSVALSSAVRWLLESDEPGIVAQAKRYLLDEQAPTEAAHVLEGPKVRALLEGQRADGGFSAAGEKSDLGSTYRVIRALYMLKVKPDTERLRAFIAKCRNADGGYGVAPGQPSAVSSTYNAAIVSYWLDDLEKK